MAVSKTCDEGSAPQCTLIAGDHIMRPSSFKRAPVADAAASRSQQQNAVEITFTSEGAAVLNTLTDQAVQAGDESRLLLKIGDEVISATRVMEPLQGDQLTIALPPERAPADVIDLLHGT